MLILTPNKGDCYEIVRAMKLILSHKSLKKKGSRSSRFIEEFGDIEVNELTASGVLNVYVLERIR